MSDSERPISPKRVLPEAIAATTEAFIDTYSNSRPKEALSGLSPVKFREQNPKGTWLMTLE